MIGERRGQGHREAEVKILQFPTYRGSFLQVIAASGASFKFDLQLTSRQHWLGFTAQITLALTSSSTQGNQIREVAVRSAAERVVSLPEPSR